MKKRTCGYEQIHAGRCGAPVEKGQKFCKEHYGIQCRICERQATRECGWGSAWRTGFTGSFVKVCGVALCGSARCKAKHYGIAKHGDGKK